MGHLPSTVFIQPMSRFEHRRLDPGNVRPRRTAFSFPQSIPKHWLKGSPVQTHFFNAINLFVVSFEDFMGRVMRGRLVHLKDPEFLRQVRGFMGQEATHSFVHTKYLANLRAQGYQIDRYLEMAERIFRDLFEKRFGPVVCIATIAGFEHMTALLAEIVLSSGMLKEAEPAMAELWEWHAAEEIEHKSLAFDLLQVTNKSYLLRLLGAFLGTLVVAGFIHVGLVMLLKQDNQLWRLRTLRDAKELLLGKHRMAPRALGLFFKYFRPGFHPAQYDNYSLAESVLQAQEPEQEGFRTRTSLEAVHLPAK
ncbi:metal-dependent hydrolase [Stigmatella aurantiaca]|nr:metal-dependent hydrolase [Stigmatella aurantiaca]